MTLLPNFADICYFSLRFSHSYVGIARDSRLLFAGQLLLFLKLPFWRKGSARRASMADMPADPSPDAEKPTADATSAVIERDN